MLEGLMESAPIVRAFMSMRNFLGKK